MATILDPDLLNNGTEIILDTTARPRTIEITNAGNMQDNKVALQVVFSFFYDEMKRNNTLIKHPMPLEPIDGPSGTQFDLHPEWAWKNVATTSKVVDGGWAWKKANGDSMEEWMNITSLGAFLDNANDRASFAQGDPNSPVNVTDKGEVNQAIKIYGDATHGDFDYRSDFIMYLREQAKTFEIYDLMTAQNLTALTYKKYQVVLANLTDKVVTHSDAEVALAPYTNINLTIHATNQVRDISGTNRNFKRIWNADSKSLEQLWEKHQYLYRQTSDIDEGSGTLRGDTAETSMSWKDGILYVDGFVDDVADADKNRIVFKDATGVDREYKYASAGVIKPNANLVNDVASYVRIFFENDDAGDDTGRDYGTDNAILMKDNDGADLSFDISGRTEIPFSYDFDGNVQRGAASAGTLVPYVAVASGIDGSLYIVARGTIGRTKTNDIILVASKMLTYTNPA